MDGKIEPIGWKKEPSITSVSNRKMNLIKKHIPVEKELI